MTNLLLQWMSSLPDWVFLWVPWLLEKAYLYRWVLCFVPMAGYMWLFYRDSKNPNVDPFRDFW